VTFNFASSPGAMTAARHHDAPFDKPSLGVFGVMLLMSCPVILAQFGMG